MMERTGRSVDVVGFFADGVAERGMTPESLLAVGTTARPSAGLPLARAPLPHLAVVPTALVLAVARELASVDPLGIVAAGLANRLVVVARSIVDVAAVGRARGRDSGWPRREVTGARKADADPMADPGRKRLARGSLANDADSGRLTPAEGVGVGKPDKDRSGRSGVSRRAELKVDANDPVRPTPTAPGLGSAVDLTPSGLAMLDNLAEVPGKLRAMYLSNPAMSPAGPRK
eukprot:TRINITY_DN22103_c0_g1_i2.p2 TRINITY_DN22103_c0_g1~~TRINITY_DN22103_c0_g1_i2.p2  ORF type:complete len:231 (-),score=24.67 TRINITY_DN22103_c0_g1_i2:513-1205(-)